MSIKENRIHHWQFTRFVAVGLFNTLFFFIAFSLAQNHVGLSRGLAITLAYAASIIVGYSAQATFTFERTIWNLAQVVRFIIAIGSGYAITQLMMQAGRELGAPDMISILLLGVPIAFVNWLVFKSWVFGGNEARHKATSERGNGT